MTTRMPSVPLLLYTSLPNQCAVARDGGRLDPCRSTPAPLRTGRPPPEEGRSYTIALRPLLLFFAAVCSFPVWIGGWWGFTFVRVSAGGACAWRTGACASAPGKLAWFLCTIDLRAHIHAGTLTLVGVGARTSRANLISQIQKYTFFFNLLCG